MEESKENIFTQLKVTFKCPIVFFGKWWIGIRLMAFHKWFSHKSIESFRDVSLQFFALRTARFFFIFYCIANFARPIISNWYWWPMTTPFVNEKGSTITITICQWCSINNCSNKIGSAHKCVAFSRVQWNKQIHCLCFWSETKLLIYKFGISLRCWTLTWKRYKSNNGKIV